MQKFVITIDGELRFGDVKLHRDLLTLGDTECYGGGSWELCSEGTCIALYGESFDFGRPDFSQLKTVDWFGVGGKPMSIIYFPEHPKTDGAQLIYNPRMS